MSDINWNINLGNQMTKKISSMKNWNHCEYYFKIGLTSILQSELKNEQGKSRLWIKSPHVDLSITLVHTYVRKYSLMWSYKEAEGQLYNVKVLRWKTHRLIKDFVWQITLKIWAISVKIKHEFIFFHLKIR